MKRSVRDVLWTCLALATILVATPARGAEYNAVITNFGGAPRANAHLDVSFDTSALVSGPIDVLFDVFSADGSLLATFAVPANANGFASSAWAPAPNHNLFLLSGGEPALVRARTPQAATSGTATLQQRGSGSRLLVSVPPDRNTDGTGIHAGQRFSFHVGDLRGVATASLLVADVSGADVAVDVSIGTRAAPGAGKYSTPQLRPRNTWRVDLQPDDENSNLVLTSTGDVIVQLVIDDGRLNALTVLPAAF